MRVPSFDEFFDLAIQMPENRFVTSDQILDLYNSKYAELYNAQQKGDLGAGFAGGMENVKSMGKYAGAAVADLVGADGTAQSLIESAQENERKAGLYADGRITKIEDINGIGDLVDFVQYQAGNLAPTMGESVIGAGIGAAVSGGANPVGALAGAVAKGTVKDVVKDLVTRGVAREAAEKIAQERVGQVIRGEVTDEVISGIIKGRARSLGAQLGAGATGYQMGTGDLYGTSVEAGDPSAGLSLLGAIPYAGVDLLTGKLIADPVFRGVKAGSSAGANAAKTGVASTVAEGGAEATQEELNIQLQGYLDEDFDTTGAEANSRRLNALVIGGLAGGVSGGVAGAVAKPIEVQQAETLNNAIVEQARNDVLNGRFESLESVEQNLNSRLRANELLKEQKQRVDTQRQVAETLEKVNAANRAEKQAQRDFRTNQAREAVRNTRDSAVENNPLLALRGEVIDDTVPESNRIGQPEEVIEGQFEDTLLLPPGDIRKRDGSPFPTEKSARVAYQNNKSLQGKRLIPVEVDGGWVLRDATAMNQKALPQLTPTENETVSVTPTGTAFTETMARAGVQERRETGLTPDVVRANNIRTKSSLGETVGADVAKAGVMDELTKATATESDIGQLLRKEMGAEKRSNSTLREAVDALPPDERDATIAELRRENEQIRERLYTSPVTGIANRAKYEDATPKPYVASIDVDSLKWVNDEMGHQYGDQLLRGVAQALSNAGIEVYHVSGDEFVAQADSAEVLAEQLQAANDALIDFTMQARKSDGSTITKKAAGFSFGVADNMEIAEERMHENKLQREKQGLRAGRGEQPKGVRRSPATVYNPEKDGLITGVAKLGGINLDEMVANGLDKADANRYKWGIKRAFHNGSGAMTLDAMRENLNQYGYQLDDVNALLDKLTDAMRGDDVPVGLGNNDDAMAAEYEAHMSRYGEDETGVDYDYAAEFEGIFEYGLESEETTGNAAGDAGSAPEVSGQDSTGPDATTGTTGVQSSDGAQSENVDPFDMGGTRLTDDETDSFWNEGFELDSPTQTGLEQADQAAEDARKARAEQERVAAEREQADRDRDDFQLTGSTAPADANPRQGDLLMAARRAERAENNAQNLKSESESKGDTPSTSNSEPEKAEVEAVTIENQDQFDDFIASAVPGIEYAITWSDGKTTKIRDIESSIPRLEKIADRLFLDETIRRKGDEVVVTQEDLDADSTVAIDETLDEDAVVESEPEEAVAEPVVEGFYENERLENRDPTEAEAKKVQDAVENKSALEVLQWLAASAPTKSYREIAKRLAQRMKTMEKAGAEFSFKVTHIGDTIPSSQRNSRAWVTATPGSNLIEINLNGTDVTGKVGMSYETVLHEMVHAVTQVALENAKYKSEMGTDMRQAYEDMTDLRNAIVDHFNNNVENNPDNLTDFERRIYAREVNTIRDIDEILAWGLTNADAQKYFDSIPYKKQSVWSKFVNTIRRLLGLEANQESALSELLRVADNLINSDVEPAIVMGNTSGPKVSDQINMASVADTVGPRAKEIRQNLKPKLTAVKRMWRQYFVRWGNTTEEVGDLKNMADSSKNAAQVEVRGLLTGVEKVVKSAFGVKKFYDLPKATIEAMDKYLKGDTNQDLPAEVKAVLDDNRNYIDSLSDRIVDALEESMLYKLNDKERVEYLTNGVFPARFEELGVLFNTIEEKKGEYLNRSFRIFSEGEAYVKQVLANDNLVGRLKNHFREQNLRKVASKGVPSNAANRDEVVDAAVEYLRNETFSDLLTDKTVARLDGLRGELLRDPYRDAQGNTVDDLQGVVESFLYEASRSGDLAGAFGNGQLYGQKNTSIFNKRKEIDPIILEALGEYTDPMVNFATTATKMSNYIANHNFLKSVYEEGKGVFFYDKAETVTTPDGEKLSYNVQFQGKNTLDPLDGMYFTPEFEQSLRDMTGGFDSSEFMNQIIKYNSMVKFGKTVLSPTTQFRNFFSGPSFVFAMGHNPFSKEFVGTWVKFKNDLKGDNQYADHLAKMVRLGVLQDNANSTELRKTLDEFTDVMEEAWINDRGVKGGFKRSLQFAQKTYQWGDDFWKMMTFEKEKRDWMNAGLNEAQAEAKAAYRVRNGMPTYSMVPRAIQLLRRTPLIGSFVAFPYEVIRTTYNNLRFIQEDLVAGKQGAAGRTAMAHKRMAGMLVTMSAAYAMTEMSKAMLGISDEEDDAIKLLGPDWQRNSNLIYIGFDEKTGSPQFIDSTYTDPFALVKRTMNALVNDNNLDMQEKLTDSFKEIALPFVGWDIVASALGEIAFNQKLSGGDVYNEQATSGEKTGQILSHLKSAVQPGIWSNAERMVFAITGRKTPTGKEFTVEDEVIAFFGFRATTMDEGQALTYKGYALKDQLNDSQRLLSRMAADANPVSNDEIRGAFEQAIEGRRKTYSHALKMIEGMRMLGNSDQEIRAALQAGNFSKADVAKLMSGSIPRWEMSRQFIQTAAERMRASSAPDQDKQALLKDYQQRKLFINQLAREQDTSIYGE